MEPARTLALKSIIFIISLFCVKKVHFSQLTLSSLIKSDDADLDRITKERNDFNVQSNSNENVNH